MSVKKKLIVGGITLILLIVVLALALWGAETWARQQIVSTVTTNVRQALSLDAARPVTVRIAGFSVLAQAATGKLDQVDVSVDDVSVGELSGNVAVRVTGIPIDTSKPVDRVQISFAATEKSVQAIAHELSDAKIDSVEFAKSEVRLGSKFSVFGFPVKVTVAVKPFADKGEIAFTPTSVEVNGIKSSVKDLTKVFDGLATSLLQTRNICVARYLPAVLGLEDVKVDGDTLAVVIGGSKVVLDEKAMNKLGVCPRTG